MSRFGGRVALVTGAARGQGRSHAVHLAREGADLVLVDAPAPMTTLPYPLGTAEELAETAQLVEKEGRRALQISADIRRSDEMRAVVDATLAEFGKLDVAVANAAVCSFKQIAEMTDEVWQDVIDVNLTGTANTLRAVLPTMIERKYGRIVVISSGAGRWGVPNIGHYVASKWGVIGLAKTVALETAEHGGITCNVVAPGTVDTPQTRHDAIYRLFAPGVENPTVEDMEAGNRAKNPMRLTWIDAVDITNAVLFLASDEARYVTGTVLEVNGGMSAHNTA